ncbi:MAG: hypothetical protein R6V27_09425 [Balneolaceae bacterium]
MQSFAGKLKTTSLRSITLISGFIFSTNYESFPGPLFCNPLHVLARTSFPLPEQIISHMAGLPALEIGQPVAFFNLMKSKNRGLYFR